MTGKKKIIRKRLVDAEFMAACRVLGWSFEEVASIGGSFRANAIEQARAKVLGARALEAERRAGVLDAQDRQKTGRTEPAPRMLPDLLTLVRQHRHARLAQSAAPIA